MARRLAVRLAVSPGCPALLGRPDAVLAVPGGPRVGYAWAAAVRRAWQLPEGVGGPAGLEVARQHRVLHLRRRAAPARGGSAAGAGAQPEHSRSFDLPHDLLPAIDHARGGER